MSSPSVFFARPKRSATCSSTDRPMRFGWNRRNGTSSKPSRRICSARRRSMILSRTRATTESLGAAVAAAGFAVFILTGDSRVVFANAKAEDLCPARNGACGMSTGGSRPRVPRSPRACTRSRALGHGLDEPKAISGAPSSFAAAKIARRLSLMSSRSPRTGPWPSSTSTRPAAAVFIVDPAGFGAQIQHFRRRFGLAARRDTRSRRNRCRKRPSAAAARSTSPRRRCVPTRTCRILEENRNQPSDRAPSAGFLRPPCQVRRAAPDSKEP